MLSKITDVEVQNVYVQSQPDKLTGTAQQNKSIFDALPLLIKNKINEIVDILNSTTDSASGADNIGATALPGRAATTIQGILEELGVSADGADRLVTLFAAIQSIGSVTADSTRLCTGQDIVDYISIIGGGDMLKAAYDPNNNGNKVAKAELADNASKLNGKEPDKYMEYADLDNVPTAGSSRGAKSGGIKTLIDSSISAANIIIRADFSAGNAGAHNAIYRGKFLGTSVTPEQFAQIDAGTFEDMYIGDYWTISGINWRIADFDYYLHTGYDPDNADGRWGEVIKHHVVIVPDRPLGNYQKMNSTDITTGGYVGSEMRTTNMTEAKNIIKAAFGESHILVHKDHLVNAVYNGYPSGGGWMDSDIELMTEWMVYGAPVFHPMGDGSRVCFNYEVGCRQLNLFRHRSDLIHSDAWRFDYWLRDVVSAAHFALVSSFGLAYCYGASLALGVRPAFCLIS